MITSSNFKTQTHMIERKNIAPDGTWLIALDIGYSSVKGFANNSVFSFPSYARKLTSQMLSFGEINDTDILYRNETTGEMWSVGALAEEMIASDEARESLAELYGRNRYFSELFKVISEVGLGIGLLANKYDDPTGKKLSIQTGLPPAYIKSDTELLKESISGDHNFSIKVGKRKWFTYKFSVDEKDVHIMPQPMGTLFSISTDENGKTVKDAEKYFKSSVLILDPGFGTLDVFNIRNRMIASSETFDNLGMKRVFEETSDLIMKKYHQEIAVPAMQKYLKSGNIKCFNRKTRTTTVEPFSDLLSEANKMVCLESLAKIDNIYNGLSEHDFLVIAGGTGAAWNDIIRDYYNGMNTLTIINGGQNDYLPAIFSNVRGYYMYLNASLSRGKSSKKV